MQKIRPVFMIHAWKTLFTNSENQIVNLYNSSSALEYKGPLIPAWISKVPYLSLYQ